VLAEAVSIVLAQRLGRDTAHHLLEQCCNARWPNNATCARCSATSRVTAELSATELDRLLDPAHYLGQARTWVERAVAEHSALTA
jgi:3-carboxy-cis,cis-muconate cycloisomerase